MALLLDLPHQALEAVAEEELTMVKKLVMAVLV
jgi:hypothetical protein